MYEITEKRQCKTCEYSDPKALEYNKQMHDAKKWADSKAWCRYPFRLEYSDDFLTCLMHPDHVESKALNEVE
jgi:hypothetical protein